MAQVGASSSSSGTVVEVSADIDTIQSVLSGTAGIASYPAAAAAANAVSMAEVLRYIQETLIGTTATYSLPRIVERATATLPQTTAEALFTVSGGNIELLAIVGEVTTVIQTQVNNTKLTFNPTGAGSSTDICAVLDISAKAVGTLFSISGDISDAMLTGLWLAEITSTANTRPLILAPGTIDLDCAASNTGNVEWQMIYRPLQSAATVASA